MGEWQDITSAPKDTYILLCGYLDGPHDPRIKMGYWWSEEQRWRIDGASWKPVWWTDVPAAPGASPPAPAEFYRAAMDRLRASLDKHFEGKDETTYMHYVVLPETDSPAPAEAIREEAALAGLIEDELLGVDPLVQCIDLEDEDWRLIIAALRQPTPRGDGEESHG